MSETTTAVLSPPREGWLSRDEAAAHLGVHSRTIRRWYEEADILHPERDERGRVWFDPEEVERVARERRGADVETRDAETALDEGEVAARMFAIFNAGRGPREVVVELRLPPTKVKEVFDQWVALEGGLLIPESIRRHLDTAAGRRVSVENVAYVFQRGVAVVRASRTCAKCSVTHAPSIAPVPHCPTCPPREVVRGNDDALEK